MEGNKLNQQINEISTAILAPVNEKLVLSLIVAQTSYSAWKAGGKSDSDLAKDARAFQDLFKGFLNMLRANSNSTLAMRVTKKEKLPAFSWPKMVKAIAKKGSGYQKQLLKEQGKYEKIHLDFTEIMKGTKSVSKGEMETYFQNYVQHIFTVLSSIDLTIDATDA